MDKLIHKIYFFMIIIGFVLILICGASTMGSAYEEDLVKAKPIRFEQVDDAMQHYYFALDEDNKYGIDFAMFSHHQFVRAFADDEEIYTQNKGGGIWGKSSGSMWNFMHVPYGTKELRVEVESVYESVEKENHTFYIGNSLMIYKNIFKYSVLAMLASIILVIMGIAMTVYGIMVNRRLYTERSMIYLGIFIMIFGLWSFNETDGAALIFNHRVTSAFSAFIYLMMMIGSFCYSQESLLQLKKRLSGKLSDISVYLILLSVSDYSLRALWI